MESCEKMINAPIQPTATRISVGASQLAVLGGLALTSSKTSPGAAKRFVSRLNNEEVGWGWSAEVAIGSFITQNSEARSQNGKCKMKNEEGKTQNGFFILHFSFRLSGFGGPSRI